jgi:CopG family transcriptional regulator, nickel-responsive regulator
LKEKSGECWIAPSSGASGDAVSNLVRFSVSLDADLLAKFDRFCEDKRMAPRSEAVSQLLYERSTAAWESDAEDVTATLTLVYDHHRTN